MDSIKLEDVLSIATATPVIQPYPATELSDLQLALVGGGMGECTF